MASGTVEVNLFYLRNTTTRAFLLLFSQGPYTGYFALMKQNGQEQSRLTLEGLPQGHYTVNGYDMGTLQEGSLPSDQQPAISLRDIVLEAGAAFWTQSMEKKQ